MPPPLSPGLTCRRFGALPDGRAVDVYTITNGNIEFEAINFGAIITSLRVADRQGRATDVVIGHATLPPYLPNPAYFGAVIGRCANRIAYGRFELDGVAYQLATNDGPHHLHGGVRGFDQQLWTAAPVSLPGAAGIQFSRTSGDGEEGYPGTLQVRASYIVEPNDTVVLGYHAVTDAPTIVNLTQHTYFNLGDADVPEVTGHELQIAADQFVPIDSGRIPTGETREVAGTPFDFRHPVRLGDQLGRQEEQLRRGVGFDHTFVLNRRGDGRTAVCRLREPRSGRQLEVATTEPGLQLYTGQLLDGRLRSASGRRLAPYAGLCLETQHFPDSPNRPRFPAVTLRPGQTFESTTIWRFAVD